MKYSLLFISLFIALNGKAQSIYPDTVVKNTIYTYADQMPSAGFTLNDYLATNLHYPDSASTHNIEGRVIISFVVNEDGTITDCQVKQGFNQYCDSEALRVVKEMPPWKPGKQDGKPVKVRFNFPIVFKLTD